MNRNDLENIFINAMMALRRSGIVPIDTGNLAYNAIKGMWTGNTYKIYIDSSVAPYAPYTVEKWKKGRNPNEGWVEKAFRFIGNYISQRLGGKIG